MINDRKVFPVTILKWSINAPFNWILKGYGKWLPWLHLGGWHSTAKNTLGIIALAGWRVHNKTGHIIGFASANGEAPLGHVISQTTLPIMINEVKGLNTDRYGYLFFSIENKLQPLYVHERHKNTCSCTLSLLHRRVFRILSLLVLGS